MTGSRKMVKKLRSGSCEGKNGGHRWLLIFFCSVSHLSSFSGGRKRNGRPGTPHRHLLLCRRKTRVDATTRVGSQQSPLAVVDGVARWAVELRREGTAVATLMLHAIVLVGPSTIGIVIPRSDLGIKNYDRNVGKNYGSKWELSVRVMLSNGFGDLVDGWRGQQQGALFLRKDTILESSTAGLKDGVHYGRTDPSNNGDREATQTLFRLIARE
nr:hypothetical protein Iba_chr02dCG6580 [Ipomoea batatas]